jgi:hypothetical protein
MSEEQYRLLCDICDQMLLERRGAEERLAIAWLHILREHTALLVPYMGLFSGRDFASRLQWLRPIRALEYSFKIFRQLAWAFCYSLAQRKRGFGQKQKFDVLIVSHMLDKDEENTADDLYFGPIARELAEKGLRVGVLYINHARKRPLSTMELETKSDLRRFVLGRTTSLRTELRFLVGLFGESKSLKASSCAYQGLARVARIAAAAEAFAPATFNALRIASQVEAMIAELAPDYLLTTFEGHAWERVTFLKAHAVCLQIKCFAYQHSATFRLQHAISRPLGGMADPDLALASGPVAAQQLSSSWGQGRCLLIGSPKAKVGLGAGSKKISRAGKRCLVLPEGIESEAILLTAFCFECAAAIPDVVFVLRFHPAFNFRAILKHAPQYSKLPPNVEISTGQSLSTDASSALWAIYRGSTAIIGAIEQGVEPVYLAQDQEMTIDPLFALGDDRQTIKTVEDFVGVIKATPLQRNGTYRAVAYCKEIFSPLNMDVLVNALELRME